jgi:predicted lipid-binding transport protein (Tim44 family)
MQAFLIGLLSLLTLLAIVAMGILLFPLALVGGLILGIAAIVTFLILAIWILGKVIIFIWNKFFKERI